VVTKPFAFEGQQRSRIADQGLSDLEKEVDAIIIVPNDRLLSITSKDTSFKDAFAMSDEILRQAVEGISELITTQGIVNIDFADIRSVMSNAGSAFMGIGSATGENRAEESAYNAINSPLLDVAISGAKGVLFAIAGGDDITMHEVNSIAKIVTESVDPDAKIIFGPIHDDKLKKGEIKVTVIATGFTNPQKKPMGSPQASQVTIQRSTSVAQPQREIPIEKREIHNQLPEQPRRPVEKIIEEIGEDDDEDFSSAIPAFLRRSKK
jgi:cell division protein FtsZ